MFYPAGRFVGKLFRQQTPLSQICGTLFGRIKGHWTSKGLGRTDKANSYAGHDSNVRSENRVEVCKLG